MPLLNDRLLALARNVPPSNVSVPVPIEEDVPGVELLPINVVGVVPLVLVQVAVAPQIVVPPEVLAAVSAIEPPPSTTTAPTGAPPVALLMMPEMVSGLLDGAVVRKVGSPVTVMALVMIIPLAAKPSVVPAAIANGLEPAPSLPTVSVPPLS